MSIRRVVVVMVCALGGAACSSSTTPTPAAATPGLWVVGGSNDGPNLANVAFHYTTAQLQASGSPTPAVTLAFPVTTGHNINASGVAFDRHGNMWVVNDNSNTVVEYTGAQLASSGSPTPAVTLSLPSSDDSYALAFDGQGNLWVGNNQANNVVEFTASQLTTSGSPTPTITISENPSQPGGFEEPIGLAFDAHGDLWVANNASSTIVEYSASQLTTSGTPTPAVTLSGSAILDPNDIAFDATGNLWISNSAWQTVGSDLIGHGTMVEYAASLLTTGGSPTPTLVINPPTGQYGSVPTGLAFDNSGDLWYADDYTEAVGEFTPAQLASAGGNLTPAISLVSPTTTSGVGIAFYPHASGLPLY